MTARDRNGFLPAGGELQTVDCLVTGGEIALHVEAVGGSCDAQMSFTAYALSPRALEEPIWEKLRAERRAFDCLHPATPEMVFALTSLPADASAPIPDTPAGRALTWVLSAIARPPTEADVTEHLAPALLENAPAAKHVAAFARLGASYAPPLVERVTSLSPDRVVVVVRSGNREVPILGRNVSEGARRQFECRYPSVILVGSALLCRWSWKGAKL